MKDMNATLTEKLAILESIQSAISDNGKKLAAIEQAIKAMPDYGLKITAINTEIINLLQAVKDGSKSETDAMAEIARKIEELKLNSGVSTAKETMKYVDLGLPSGIKWAKCDLGARRPENFGSSYSWGETWEKIGTDYYYFTDIVKGQYTKYDSRDKRYFLEKEDDVAYLRLGEGWRYPTWNEMQELIDNCTVTESTLNGKLGVMFVSKINNNYIFFAYFSELSSGGYRWSSALVPSNPSTVKCLYFKKKGDRIVVEQLNVIRDENATAIRPVYVKRKPF